MAGKIELLAPAGDWDAFVAAVENGADAVYLGTKLFNARQYAGNFDGDQLKRACEYAHVRDVNVYLVMNTLISDAEMEEALHTAGMAYLAGIDGIIVQDLGFSAAVGKYLPDLPLHGSTQMTVYDLEGVRALEQRGFQRVVLARELPMEEIRHIASNCKIEIEVFIHGALCISYSGQCLMSSIIGGRSGNRGKCAQPCRLPYELVVRGGREKENRTISTRAYLLSPKDICGIHHLGEIARSGVKSLKLEGRMKSPEYVAVVTAVYRKYLDRLLDGLEEQPVESRDARMLAQIFNRGGFSSGYLKGKTGKEMMCFEKPKNWGIYLGEVIAYDRSTGILKLKLDSGLAIGDGIEVWNGEDESPGTIVTEIRKASKNVEFAEADCEVSIGKVIGKVFKGNKVYKTSDKRQCSAAKETYTGKSIRKVAVYGYISLKKDRPAVLHIHDEKGNEVTVNGVSNIQPAMHKPLTMERVREQLEKTGNTPFSFSKLEIEMDSNVSMPLSELNALRRDALGLLETKRALRYDRVLSGNAVEIIKNRLYFPGNSRYNGEKSGDSYLRLSVFFYRPVKGFAPEELDAERLYLPLPWVVAPDNRQSIEHCRKQGKEIYAWLPNITRGYYAELLRKKLSMLTEAGVDGILAGNIGVFEMVSGTEGLKLAGDYTLNIFNSLSLAEYQSMGLQSAALSPELSLQQVQRLKGAEGLQTEAIVYGRIPLMTSEYCPVGGTLGGHAGDTRCSGLCGRGDFSLRDRKGMEFPVFCDRTVCRSVILNANILYMADHLTKLQTAGIDMARIYIWDEDIRKVQEIVAMHKDFIHRGEAAAGKHGRLIEEIKEKGFTRGHYFRGV